MASIVDHQLFVVTKAGFLDFVPNYNKRVKELKPGDRLHFPSGKTFVLGELLGHGQTTLVWAIQDQPGLALRIPSDERHVDYINYSLEGESMLTRMGVPHVPIYDYEFYQYIVVQRLKNFVTFEKFYQEYTNYKARRDSKADFPVEQMRTDFMIFARSTAMFRKIGDAHAQNLVYNLDQKIWLLMDWSDSHQVSYSTRKPFLFLTGKNFSEDLMYHLGEFEGRDFYPFHNSDKWLADFYRQIQNEVESSRTKLRGRFMCEDIFDIGVTGSLLSAVVKAK